jgi:hypothetical protein
VAADFTRRGTATQREWGASAVHRSVVVVGPREQQNNNTFVAYLHRREPGASSRRCPCTTVEPMIAITYIWFTYM